MDATKRDARPSNRRFSIKFKLSTLCGSSQYCYIVGVLKCTLSSALRSVKSVLNIRMLVRVGKPNEGKVRLIVGISTDPLEHAVVETRIFLVT